MKFYYDTDQGKGVPKQEVEELSEPGENGMLYIQIRSVQQRESKTAFETSTESSRNCDGLYDCDDKYADWGLRDQWLLQVLARS